MPLTLDTTKAVLISAASETPSGVKGGVTTIPSTDWAFADCRTVPFPGTPDPVRFCLKSGFNTRFARPGDIAELYQPGAEGPLWWGDHEDPVRGLPAWELLHRCSASRTWPKISTEVNCY